MAFIYCHVVADRTLPCSEEAYRELAKKIAPNMLLN